MDFQQEYACDLEGEFANEIGQIRELIQGNENTSIRPLLQQIIGKKLQSVFTNVDIALQLFLDLPVTNVNRTCSFSKLALVKIGSEEVKSAGSDVHRK